ncbi:MAG: HAD-IA family hydrolase [Arenicellales bacterium]
MKKYKLIIFDWDGTLMDSAAKIVACFQAAARDLKLPVPKASLVEIQIGLSLEKAWANILTQQEQAFDEAYLLRASERCRDYFLGMDQTPMPLYAGVEAGLTALNSAGYLLAVATGKVRRGLSHVLDETGLAPYFVYTRCGDEAFSKPHPQMVLDCLDFCGGEAQEAIVVGDTTYDMQMAKNAGVDSLAVSYGVYDASILRPLASMECVDDFKAVSQYFLI